MQIITFYARAAETLGEFTDYANAKTVSAPILTKGVAVCLKMRIFKEEGSLDPVPVDSFADVKAWQWVMDDDFDSTSNYILVAQHDKIAVDAKTEEIEGESREFTEFTIPIPEMNTKELDAVLQKKENVANLNGELVGLNGAGEAVYILQLKGFTVRNRISSAGNPTPITAEYYTAVQTRAIIAGTNAYELARNAEFHIGDRAYYPGKPGYLLICAAEGTSAAELPYLPVDGSNLLDGSVIWKVYDMSVSDGAAKIMVNGVEPDDEGNIQLNAENISFNLKDSLGYDIPTAPAINNINLQDFFVTMQYAIFSVNGHCAYIDPSAPTVVQGDISIYGNTMYLTEDDALPESDWDGNTLNTKTVYDLAVDVYTHSIKEISIDGGETYSTAENGKLNLTINCPASGWVASALGVESGTYYPLAEILDFLSRYSIYTINGMSVYDEDIGDINLTADDIPMQMLEDGLGNLSPDWTIREAMDFKAGYPYFYSPETREINTVYYEDEPGYLIVRVKFTDGTPEEPVTVEFNDNVIAKLQPGSAGEWQTFAIPFAYDYYIVRTPDVGTANWYIEVEFLIMNA